jgi:hypothetical protein
MYTEVRRNINGKLYAAGRYYDETLRGFASLARRECNDELDHLERQYRVLDTVIKNYVGGFYSQQRHK